MEKQISYTAIEQLGWKNMKDFGLDRPIPANDTMIEFLDQRIREKGKKEINKSRSALEAHAINFIRNRCKELRFNRDEKHMNLEDNDGKSLKLNQIPYNVEMDLDRRCLEVAVHQFMESGTSNDAFDIYYIYLEMFIGSYDKTQRMVEMLSEFETNASSLLMKHRDHYSHSVYVFLMGLAYYDSSESFRNEYRNKYKSLLQYDNLKDNEQDLAAHFLKYWGLTALFHDIGYPFELSFEQLKSYYNNTIDYVPYIMFNMNDYVICDTDTRVPEIQKKLDKVTEKLNKENDPQKREKLENEQKELEKLIKTLEGKKEECIKKLGKLCPNYDFIESNGNINRYFAKALSKCLGENYTDYKKFKEYASEKNEDGSERDYSDYLFEVFNSRNDPSKCNGFIDHAYFSALILTVNLLNVVELEDINEMYSNAITSILLHNSLYKFSITNYKDNGKSEDESKKAAGYNTGHHFTVQQSPLAFLLMLCDEIQCWGRTSYGRNSRGQIHPMDCRLEFRGDKIDAVYIFDSKYSENKFEIKEEYKNTKGTYSKIESGEFLGDIEDIVSINGDNSFGQNAAARLFVDYEFLDDTRYRKTYLSASSFINLYAIAFKVHNKNHPKEAKKADKDFSEMSLEYKMDHINRAKKYARYLHEIDCFYSDRPVDFEVVTEITDKTFPNGELEYIGKLEHDRWCFRHYVMGWRYGEEYCKTDNSPEDYDEKAVRERMRVHKDMCMTEGGYKQEIAFEHYDKQLEEEDRAKDKRPVNNFLDILSKDDGITVYKLDLKRDDKEKMEEKEEKN